jgi:hypothetical protein
MGKKLALVNKLKRREKQVRNAADGFDTYNKMDKSEETRAKSPKAQQLARKIQRRLDRNFGVDAIGQEPKLSKRNNCATVERFDYGGSDFGIRVTMAAGLIADMGVRPNDIVMFLEGDLKGYFLKVIAVTDSTHLRLEDSQALNFAGETEVTQVQTVADVASSLDGTYFLLKSAGDAISYYVWIDVDAGGNDPAPGGTGIQVSISADDDAETVAAAVASAIDAEADFSASAADDTVTISNATVGDTTDAADADTGFAISVLFQGEDADPTVSESNIIARFQLSDVKSSYK